MQIIKQDNKSLTSEVLNDCEISDNKGVNIPDAILPISSLLYMNVKLNVQMTLLSVHQMKLK